MTDPPKEEPERVEKCRHDTNQDGDCGRRDCPDCSKYRHNQDISKTPAPQQWGIATY